MARKTVKLDPTLELFSCPFARSLAFICEQNNFEVRTTTRREKFPLPFHWISFSFTFATSAQERFGEILMSLLNELSRKQCPSFAFATHKGIASKQFVIFFLGKV